MEGAIPPKGDAFDPAGNPGPGDSSANKQNSAGARDMGEFSRRFQLRDEDQIEPGTQAPKRHSAITKPAIQTPAELPAAKLSEPARHIAAMLAEEDEEAHAGKRLAARFVRQPSEQPVQAPRSIQALKPYLAAGASLAVLTGALAVYLFQSGASTGQSAYTAAAIQTPPESVLFGYSGSEAPVLQGEGAGASSGQAPSPADWALTVETFRVLAGSAPAAPPEKAEEPDLDRLVAGFNSNEPK